MSVGDLRRLVWLLILSWGLVVSVFATDIEILINISAALQLAKSNTMVKLEQYQNCWIGI